MKLSTIQRLLSLTCLSPPREDLDIGLGFASDILSDVLARAPKGALLVTTQSSLNVIAVASQVRIPSVILASGQNPSSEVMDKARDEGIALYSTASNTFEIVGRLFQLGIRGGLS